MTIGKDENGNFTFSSIHECEIKYETFDAIFPTVDSSIARLDIMDKDTCAIVAKNYRDLLMCSTGINIYMKLKEDWDETFSKKSKDKIHNQLSDLVEQKKGLNKVKEFVNLMGGP